jgi:hypothetical protein
MPTPFVDLCITAHSLGLRGSEYCSGDFPFKMVDHIDRMLEKIPYFTTE